MYIYKYILKLSIVFLLFLNSAYIYSYPWPRFDKKTAIVFGGVGLFCGITATWYCLARHYSKKYAQYNQETQKKVNDYTKTIKNELNES
jgi:hypothetical protein